MKKPHTERKIMEKIKNHIRANAHIYLMAGAVVAVIATIVVIEKPRTEAYKTLMDARTNAAKETAATYINMMETKAAALEMIIDKIKPIES